MRTAQGSYLLFIIVIFFVILFTGYISLSINKARAFNTKNEIVKAVERNALNLDSENFRNEIKAALELQGYRAQGSCGDGYDGYDNNGQKAGSDKASFCLKEIKLEPISKLNRKYYKVETFYQLNLPIISLLMNLKARGETKTIVGGPAI